MCSRNVNSETTQQPWSNLWQDHPYLGLPSIALPILGMLGGMCGEPVSVMLQDYPEDLIGVVLRLIRAHVPDERICEIFRPADLRPLTQRANEFALVLVYPTPGHLAAGQIAHWHLERDRRTRLPMILLVGEQADQESPGALLRLGVGPAQIARLRESSSGDLSPDPCVREYLSGSWGPRIDSSFADLRALFELGTDPLWRPRSLRSVQILRGLLTGHCLLRHIGAIPGRLDLVVPDLDDYAGVYKLLLRSRAGLPGEMGDPILAAMIRRANLYIQCREEASRGSEPVLAARQGISSLATTRQSRRDPISDRPIGLRELADLGNVRSSLASHLIDATIRTGDLREISGLGLIKRLPAGTMPASLGKEAIARLMITWSMKQVRNRFDRLRREGFIEAERVPAGNGSWVIHLPEELKPLPGEFQGLPPVERVAEACRPGRYSSA